MKHILLLYILLFSTISTFGQLKIGPRVGINLSNVNTDRTTTTATIFTSYSLRGMVEKGLGEALALQVSVLVSQKGYNFIDVEENKNALTTTSSLSFSKSSVVTSRGKKELFYLDIPLSLVYKKDLGIGKVLFGGGGYYSMNFWGVSKETNTYVVGAASDLSLSTITGTYDLKEKNELSSSDLGLLANVGMEFNEKAQLSVNYNFGLADIDPGKATTQNRVVNISFVYFIKR
jgi:hypothetical protein